MAINGEQSGKAIVLLPDGTGNSRSARFRTNVWKLYRALDQSAGAGQIAYYHDGVGTSQLAPLRLLGGIFGVGVGRNVQDLYSFLCRNYVPGDRVYIFGFSRGAFTARFLAGLITRMGIRPETDEPTLRRQSKRVFRDYRAQSYPRTPASRLFYWVRGLFVAPLGAATHDDAIELVGVWETVSAYGGPIVEMVRAFDTYIWPLSFSDYRLSGKVGHGRQALALDEERESFQPILWDESEEATGRIRQVWFAGVHSDVGGGYPDEGQSNVALEWMIDEAAILGLHFTPEARAKIGQGADPRAPLHDSRSGVGVLYRYEPRRIEELRAPPSQSALRPPGSGTAALIGDPVVHPSVLERIEHGVDGYAPIGLPKTFIVDEKPRYLPPDRKEAVWEQVRARRVLQFCLLLLVALTLLSPFYPSVPGIDTLNRDRHFQMIMGLITNAVPGLPGGLKGRYDCCGGWFLVGGIVLAILLSHSTRLKLAIQSKSRRMWRSFIAAGGASIAARSTTGRQVWAAIYRHSVWLRRAIRWYVSPFLVFLVIAGLFGLLVWHAVAPGMEGSVLSRLSMSQGPPTCGCTATRSSTGLAP